jgi:hypothetical protein
MFQPLKHWNIRTFALIILVVLLVGFTATLTVLIMNLVSGGPGGGLQAAAVGAGTPGPTEPAVPTRAVAPTEQQVAAPTLRPSSTPLATETAWVLASFTPSAPATSTPTAPTGTPVVSATPTRDAQAGTATEAKLLDWYKRSQKYLDMLKKDVAYGYNLLYTNKKIVAQWKDQGKDTAALQNKIDEFQGVVDKLNEKVQEYDLAMTFHNGYGYSSSQGLYVYDRPQAQTMILDSVMLPIQKDLALFNKAYARFNSP